MPEERAVDDEELRGRMRKLPDADVYRGLQRYRKSVRFVGVERRVPKELAVHGLAVPEIVQLLHVGHDSVAWLGDERTRFVVESALNIICSTPQQCI